MISADAWLRIGTCSVSSQTVLWACFSAVLAVRAWSEATWSPCVRKASNVLIEALRTDAARASSDPSAEFLASTSCTTRLRSESHMHGYLSKKLLLNITIVLRNVPYLPTCGLPSAQACFTAATWVALTLVLWPEPGQGGSVTPSPAAAQSSLCSRGVRVELWGKGNGNCCLITAVIIL